MNDTASAVNDAPAASAGPTTFEEAFAADASPASDSGSQSSDPPAAAVQPQTTDEPSTPASEDDRSPYIPRTRFDEVNGKLAELRQWKEQYGWAEQVPREQLQQMADWYQRANADPVAFTQSLIAELQAHPQHGPALRSLAARTLAQRSQPTAPSLDGIVVDLGNGQTLKLGDLKASLREEIMQTLQPQLQTVQTLQEERQKADWQRQADQFASELEGSLTKRPGFTEHKKAIGEYVMRRMATYPQTAWADQHLLARLAYEGYTEIVTPTLLSRGESQALDTLQQKARAASGVNPGAAAPSTTKRVESFHDLPADAWK
jgi:hypothetical protein